MTAPDAVASSDAPRGSLVRRLIGMLVAAGLLYLVASTVPWSDSLSVTWTEGLDAESWAGDLVGDWKADPVEFRVEPAAAPVEGPAVALRAEGGTLIASREPASLVVQDGPPLTASPFAVDWSPGILTVFRSLRWSAFAWALALIAVATLATIARWWILLRALQLGTPFLEAGRVVGVTLFFNVLLPGISGGDLARAVLVVRGHPERRADALVSVAVDRILGLLAMLTVALVAVWSSPIYADLRLWVAAAFGAGVGGTICVVNPWLRRVLRVEGVLARLPQGRRLGKLDQAVQRLAACPSAVAAAFLLSLVNHGIQVTAIHHLAQALGDVDLDFLSHLCVATVANTLSAVPLSPGGLGVGEALFGVLFAMGGGSYTLGVATSLTFRMGMVIAGLVGGLALLSPAGRTMGASYRAISRGLDAGDGAAPDAD